MHEVSIMTEALRLAVESARSAGATRVTSLRLRVGQMSGAVPEAMQFAWDVVREGTMAAGAMLEIEPVSATAWCGRCLKEFGFESVFAQCPQCQTLSRELRRGRELEIASVEVEMADAPAGYESGTMFEAAKSSLSCATDVKPGTPGTA